MAPKAADNELEEEEKDQGSFSRRKIVSNWDRYENAEKEAQQEGGESQRGTDFSILLSSAGDSFTQFRFAEEKEWISENLCPKQLSGLYVDCHSLVQALEELPLHLKLNVAAELVQGTTPVTLPQIKSKSSDAPQRATAPKQQTVGQRKVTSSHYQGTDPAAQVKLPNQDGLGSLSSEALREGPSVSHQEMDHLDEDLDLLLKLDTPINPGSNYDLQAISSNAASGEDVKLPCEEDALDKTEEKCSSPPLQQVASKTITEEDLEDWLDSMIS
ncbi:cell death regulator Aven isoform X2 [Tiliqua scincoides]|uniref:cell death regulator Aven isoform X2 n=1 Tax=Tiliqua scincoides TaxID=71010 RepID=UPI00346357AD